jgi:hypothetical protein
MIEVEDMPSLQENAVQCKDGVYRPARPVPTFFKLRLRDALEVLRGRAVAVYLYDGSETGPRIKRQDPKGLRGRSHIVPTLDDAAFGVPNVDLSARTKKAP